MTVSFYTVFRTRWSWSVFE